MRSEIQDRSPDLNALFSAHHLLVSVWVCDAHACMRVHTTECISVSVSAHVYVYRHLPCVLTGVIVCVCMTL